MTTINQLRDVVLIQAPSTEQDSAGEPVAAWVDVVTVWAYVRDLTPKNNPSGLNADGLQSIATTRITIRFRRDVTPEMRVVLGDVPYRIESTLDVTGRRTWLDLMCIKGLPDD